MRTLYDMLPDYDTATLSLPQRNDEGEIDLSRFSLAIDSDVMSESPHWA